MIDSDRPSNYRYRSGDHAHSHAWLLPAVQRQLEHSPVARAFDLGCGNGSVSGWLHQRGIEVAAIDSSESGIAQARLHHPGVHFEVASAYDDLAGRFGRFPLVVSLEVVEHLYDPRRFARALFDLVDVGGTAIVSAPYHGYFKNLALAITGQMDAHFTALWDGGHIKFWSIATLGQLLSEACFVDVSFQRVGRIPVLAKSMIAIARKPAV